MTHSQFFNLLVLDLKTLDSDSTHYKSKVEIFKQFRGKTYKHVREFEFVKEPITHYPKDENNLVWKVKYWSGSFMPSQDTKTIEKYIEQNLWRLDQEDSGILMK